ncbi:MAG: TonB-dependent receptor, partial [Janthinobacterium lividum]
IQDVQQFTGRIDHTFSPNLKFSNQTRYAHYATDARETAPGNVRTAAGTVLTNGNFTSIPDASLLTQLASHDRVINDHSIYNDAQLAATFATGPIKHEVITGVEIGHETYSNQTLTRNNLPLLSLTDPSVDATPANSVTSVGNRVASSANSIGAYVNDSISLGRYVKFVGGLRWDRYSAALNNTIVSARSGPSYLSQTNHFTSVRTGLIFQPTDWQSYYVSYGTSFNPSLEALTVTNYTQNLAPEKNRSYEVGSKWDLLNGNLAVTSSLFDIEKTNARTQVSSTEYQLDGRVRVQGFQTGVAGRIGSHWQVFAGYAYLDAKILDAGDGTQGHTPANTPRNTATLWTTYSLTHAWSLGGGMNYMSGRYASNTNYVKVGGYTRYDAMLAYHQHRYDVQLNLLNLTNKSYYDALIPSDGGRAVPGAGRTLLATVKYRF